MPIKVLTIEEWKKIGTEKFGADIKTWKFKCCNCGESQTLQEFMEYGVNEPGAKFYYSCIGRYDKSRGCDWTLGGLFRFHKTEVISEEGKNVPVFEFED